VALIIDPTKGEGYIMDVEAKTYFRCFLPSKPEQDSNTPSKTHFDLSMFKGDDIGEKVIEGLVCRGYGKNRQRTEVFEYWVSEELLEVVLARSVLEEEESTLRIFNIKRVEPSSNLFTIPDGYSAEKFD
jgi:hypothetical protein